MIKGVDLSTWQKQVDYRKLKEEGIEFAFLRCGYGKDASQKDDMFETHYQGCKEAGIKVGVYHYSYCTAVENAEKEAENCLSYIEGKQFDLPVFYDLEEKRTKALGRFCITEIALRFCRRIEANGYKAGVYANLDWFNNYIDRYALIDEGFKIWLAQWEVNKPTATFPYHYWQFTNKLKVAGLSVDGNYAENKEIIEGATSKIVENVEKSNNEIADEVIKGLWGNGQERKIKLSNAGYNYELIQTIVNDKLNYKSIDTLAKEVIKGLWGNGQERKNKLTSAGYNYNEVQKRVNQMLA